MSSGYIGLPPDGAGKLVPQSVMVEFAYNNGAFAFTVGDVVSFNISTTVSGTVLSVNAITGTTGTISVRIDAPVPNVFNFQVGENIIVNAVTYANIVTVSDPFYFQQTVMVGSNMANQAIVTRDGAQITAFLEGSPGFDAYGKLRTSTEHILGEYILSYDELPDEFTTEITGGASMVYDHNNRGVILTCGTAAGDKVVRTSNKYHIHQVGSSQLIQLTATIGDTGKTGVIRRGGYYDDNNGVYFEFNENIVSVGIRSSTTGTPVDTLFPQSEWNGDRLDGSGGIFNPSGKAANPTQANIFWIDMQPGAGIVRWGVVIDGVRFIAHSRNSADTGSGPYMSTGSLPIRYEQENIAVTSSSSEFRVFSGVVKTEGNVTTPLSPFTAKSTTTVSTVNETPLLTFRSAQLYKTFNNRVAARPSSVVVYNSSADPVLISLRVGSTATNGTWNPADADSSVEVNETATLFTGGHLTQQHIVGATSSATIEFPDEVTHSYELRRKADITLPPLEIHIGGQLLAAGAGGLITTIANWDETSD